MKRTANIILSMILVLLLIVIAAVLWVTKSEAYHLITVPWATRSLPQETPADYYLPFEDVIVASADGVKLVGWFIPSQNGAVIMLQHGYKSTRDELLNEAKLLYRHGYGALLTTVRAAHRLLGRTGDRLQTGGCRRNEMDRPDQPAARVSHAGRRGCSHLGEQRAAPL